MTKLTPGKIVTLLIGIGIGIFALVWGSSDFLKAPNAKVWSKTKGQVVRLWEDRSRSEHNLFGLYDFEVAGVKYSGSQYRFSEPAFPPSVKAGQTLDVYYIPDNPSMAVLDRSKPTGKLFTALLLIGLVSFGIILSVFAPDPPWMRKSRTNGP